jgi:integrative and conjugative element protein (TIGR02256 family)
MEARRLPSALFPAGLALELMTDPWVSEVKWFELDPWALRREQSYLAKNFPDFKLDERALDRGVVRFFGTIKVRPKGGTKRYPVKLVYPDSMPYDVPVVVPLAGAAEWDEFGSLANEPGPKFYSFRHQMPTGGLCLFQGDPREDLADRPNVADVLRRAGRWFMGMSTGHWPPDTIDSELESHFEIGGDIVIEEKSFFDSRFSSRGRLSLVFDFARGHFKTEKYRFLLTCATIEGGVVTGQSASSKLREVFVQTGEHVWDWVDLGKRARITGNIDEGEHCGIWVYLAKEPAPFKTGEALLEEVEKQVPDFWDFLDSTFDVELKVGGQPFVIALCYPSRAGKREVLSLLMRIAEEKEPSGGVLLHLTPASRRQVFGVAIPAVLRCQWLSRDAIFLRNSGVVSNTLEQKTVGILGLGALGSQVADLLNKAGVGRFLLKDHDNVKIANVMRHTAGIRNVGEKKVKAVRNQLYNTNPYVQSETDEIPVSSRDHLEAFLVKCDLVISVMADEKIESLVNEAAVRLGKTVIYGRAMNKCKLGRVFLVRPGIDGCKQCVGLELDEARKDSKRHRFAWLVAKDEESVILHECGRPVIAGSAVDLSFVATLISRISLDFLEGKSLANNHWLWSVEESAATGAKEFSTRSTTVEISENCLECNGTPTIKKVIFPREEMTKLTTEAAADPAVETGGILIGYIKKDEAVVTKVIGPGPKAIRSATIFRRDVEFTQTALDLAESELGQRGQYIGEWHTHLVAVPHPSGTDIASLQGISEAVNYATDCPIMIIAGVNTSIPKVSEVRAWAFPLGQRMARIEIGSLSRETGHTALARLKTWWRKNG